MDTLTEVKNRCQVLPWAGDYRDSIAKSAQSCPDTPVERERSCGSLAVVCECESGEHRFGKRLFCGREWCKDCGADGSPAHKRRQARILPKVQQLKGLGYLVIEFPERVRFVGEKGISPDGTGETIRGWCYSKAALQETTQTIVDVLAGRRSAGGRVGGFFGRGLGRWHWFGDKNPGKWNPHFNVLVESGFLEEPVLEGIKASLRSALNCPDLIVHYSYCDTPGQMVQKVRYITRATFLEVSWNPYMAHELYNFRNSRWWGDWKGKAVWDLSQGEIEGENERGAVEILNSLVNGVCPVCGRPLARVFWGVRAKRPTVWSPAVDSIYLKLWGAKEIAGTGFYWIPGSAIACNWPLRSKEHCRGSLCDGLAGAGPGNLGLPGPASPMYKGVSHE